MSDEKTNVPLYSKICKECKEPFEGIKKQRLCKKCLKERQLNRAREYKRKNNDSVLSYTRKWKKDNVEHVKIYNKTYSSENKATIRPRSNAYRRNKMKNDPSFKMACAIRARMGKFLRGERKCKKSQKILGCTFADFVLWMEFQLPDNCTMQNHGTLWHIDHVIPCARFDMTIPDEADKCFHWTNMQPMLGIENCAKNDSTSEEEQLRQIDKINVFLQQCKYEISDEMKNMEFDRLSYV